MRGVREIASASGKLTIAALDHRGSLKQSLHPDDPEATEEEEIRAWKKRLIELYCDKVGAILIDPVFGKELVDPSASCKWILSMEKTGYRGGQEARETEILPNWSVAQAKAMGAAAVKLLLYFDPDQRELAKRQKETARRVGEECRREEMLFLLEPLSYGAKRPGLVLRIVEELADLPVDVFKLEYPGGEDECRRISNGLKVPWVLLSAGTEYEHYRDNLKIACQSGAAGMAVGRAVWQEFGQYQGDERERYFREVAGPRMDELIAIVDEYGKAV